MSWRMQPPCTRNRTLRIQLLQMRPMPQSLKAMSGESDVSAYNAGSTHMSEIEIPTWNLIGLPRDDVKRAVLALLANGAIGEFLVRTVPRVQWNRRGLRARLGTEGRACVGCSKIRQTNPRHLCY